MHARSRPPGRRWPARSFLLTAFIAFPWLSGCGGGGSGDQTPNLPPQATGFCSTTLQESALTDTLPATDPDNTPGGLLFSLKADGSGGAGPITTAKGGQVQITNQTTGAFTYTPQTDPSLCLNRQCRGADTFEYHVEDARGGSASATVTVIVDPRIMPLGDSITQGIDGDNFVPTQSLRVGYRKPLYDLLTADGYGFDFVGSRTLGNSVTNFDPDNNGYAGALDEDIANGGTDGEPATPPLTFPGIIQLLNDQPADIVLLHIGTNDLTVNPTDTSAADVKTILTDIRNWQDSANGNPVAVVVAQIIPQCLDGNDSTNPPTTTCTFTTPPDTSGFNTNVVSMVSNLTAAERPAEIFTVDQYSAFLNLASEPDPTLYGNRWHPNTTGYDIMANVWHTGLTVGGPSILATSKCGP